MTQKVRPDDRRISWQGAISFNDTNSWRMPWRIPFDQISTVPTRCTARAGRYARRR